MSERPRMPHCDPLVLHAPGRCHYCDQHPEWQAYRLGAGIAFTDDDPVDGEIPCPATLRRSAEVINAWFGNRADP